MMISRYLGRERLHLLSDGRALKLYRREFGRHCELGSDLRKGRCARLFVAIDQQNVTASSCQHGRHIHREQRLADSALGIAHGQDHVWSPDRRCLHAVRTVWGG